MASLTLSAVTPCSISSSSSMAGLRLPSPAPRSTLSMAPLLPPRAQALPKLETLQQLNPQDQDFRRRALVFGAFASALALASNLPALAEEPKKKRNKCPTICVQNPTASCCFGN